MGSRLSEVNVNGISPIYTFDFLLLNDLILRIFFKLF